jgi:hypothetical protein
MMNPDTIAKAVKRLGIIRFFPVDADARLEVMEQIRRLVGNGELFGTAPEQRLTWLIDTAVTHMREWGGLPELRGLYCTRWKPADGIEMYSSLPGFTPQDSEMVVIREGQTFKAQLQSSSPKLLEAAGCDCITDFEVKELHQIANPLSRQLLAQAEQEIREAAGRRTLSDAEKQRRLEELRAALGVEA